VAPVSVCIGWGGALHPARAARYAYCTRQECQREHAVGVRVIEIGVNKSNPVLMAASAATEKAVAAGELKDQRRSSFGPRASRTQAQPVRVSRTPPRRVPVLPGTPAQQRLVRLWRQQGLTPQQIHGRLCGQLTVGEIQTIALSR
jgi:hypothetical protein